jgi:hypothetical protein
VRKVIKSLIRIVVQNEISWSVIRPFIELADYAQDRRDAFVTRQSVTDQRIMTALGQPMVKNGPFKGMIYPRFLYPSNFSKIIGSYEKEISDIIETLCNKRFTEIVNIGCAEGYYAVGFARRIDNVRVTACDNRRRARDTVIDFNRHGGISR